MTEMLSDAITLIMFSIISYVISFIVTLIGFKYNTTLTMSTKYYNELSNYRELLTEIMLKLSILELRLKHHKSQTEQNHITNHKLNREQQDIKLKVLKILNEGPKTTKEIENYIERSREHTARFMKKLYEEGYVTRDTTKKPYKYTITEKGKNYLTKLT